MSKRHLLNFLHRGAVFSVPLAACREVNRGAAINRAPRTARPVAGIANIRGDVITAIDVLELLQPSAGDDRPERIGDCLIVLRSNDAAVGLIADDALDAILIDEEEIDRAPAQFEDAASGLLEGAVRWQDRLVLLLNPAGILNARGALHDYEARRVGAGT